MNRFKRWLVERFLPSWAKETLLEDNEALRHQLAELKQQHQQLRAYLDGIKDSGCDLRKMAQLQMAILENNSESMTRYADAIRQITIDLTKRG